MAARTSSSRRLGNSVRISAMAVPSVGLASAGRLRSVPGSSSLSSSDSPQRAIACNGRRRRWHPRGVWQPRICSLHNQKGKGLFESHSLRQIRINNIQIIDCFTCTSAQRRLTIDSGVEALSSAPQGVRRRCWNRCACLIHGLGTIAGPGSPFQRQSQRSWVSVRRCCQSIHNDRQGDDGSPDCVFRTEEGV
jgi:hypothetical protein